MWSALDALEDLENRSLVSTEVASAASQAIRDVLRATLGTTFNLEGEVPDPLAVLAANRIDYDAPKR